MNIRVDADACPAVIKEILFRAAERMELPLTLVANSALPINWTASSPARRAFRLLQRGRPR